MMIALLVAIAVLALALWLSTMYVWWQQEIGATAPTADVVAHTYTDRAVRLLRRGWYALMLHLRAVGQWINGKMRALFFRIFPAAAPAFAKRDTLAGLRHGPTSYFLRSISQKEPVVVKKTAKKLFS